MHPELTTRPYTTHTRYGDFGCNRCQEVNAAKLESTYTWVMENRVEFSRCAHTGSFVLGSVQPIAGDTKSQLYCMKSTNTRKKWSQHFVIDICSFAGKAPSFRLGNKNTSAMYVCGWCSRVVENVDGKRKRLSPSVCSNNAVAVPMSLSTSISCAHGTHT